MAPVLFRHPASHEHLTGAHPERPERIAAIERELAAHDWLGWDVRESPPVADATLLAVHGAAHVQRLRALCDGGGGMLDADTVCSPRSLEAALRAAGGAVAMVDALLAGEGGCGAAVHRPPGHHASAERAMGFCLLNAVAVAARHALDAHGLERVMIVDWDVHHGNGTSDLFAAEPRVLFASIHQSPWYPGTGALDDAGRGPGEGFTVNLPVSAGTGDAAWCALVEHVVMPIALAYAPQLVLVSAGFDAHADDPLGGCECTAPGFAAMAASVRRAAGAMGAPVGLVLEGGYAVDALATSLRRVLLALEGTDAPPAPDEHALSRAARSALAGRWPALRWP